MLNIKKSISCIKRGLDKFEINDDMNRIRPSFHNLCNFSGSAVLAIFFGFFWSYGVWLIWEVGDGFKPWYYTFYWKDQPWIVNKFRQEFLYADKFSLQDAFVWDLFGALLGTLIRALLAFFGR